MSHHNILVHILNFSQNAYMIICIMSCCLMNAAHPCPESQDTQVCKTNKSYLPVRISCLICKKYWYLKEKVNKNNRLRNLLLYSYLTKLRCLLTLTSAFYEMPLFWLVKQNEIKANFFLLLH